MNSNDKITAYSNIQDYDVKKQWDNKEKWIELKPDSKTKKFSWIPLNIGAVYRVILCEEIVNFEVTICKSEHKITGSVPKNSIVSVGKTKNLSDRMKAHFSRSQINSNRLLTRLKYIFPKADGLKWLSEMILSNKIKIEYIQINDKEWWKRDLLESYGKAISGCLFDLEIEH